MVEAVYLVQERSRHYQRSIRLRLTEKGLELCGTLQDMLNRQTMALGPDSVTQDDLRTANGILSRLEWFWGGSQEFGGGPQGFGAHAERVTPSRLDHSTTVTVQMALSTIAAPSSTRQAYSRTAP